MNYQLNFAAVWRDFDTLLAGLGLGLELALVSIAIGCVIGLMMAFALLSKHRALRVLASVYVTVVQHADSGVDSVDLLCLAESGHPAGQDSLVHHHPVAVCRGLPDRSVPWRAAEHPQGAA
jgi:uncharacterized membrane protein (Fun14 family)